MPQLTPQQREEMRRRGYIADGGRTYWDMNSSGAAGDNPDLQNYFGGHMETADLGPGVGADAYNGQQFQQFDANGTANRAGQDQLIDLQEIIIKAGTNGDDVQILLVDPTNKT